MENRNFQRNKNPELLLIGKYQEDPNHFGDSFLSKFHCFPGPQPVSWIWDMGHVFGAGRMSESIKHHPPLFIQRLRTLHIFTESEYFCSLPPRKPLLLAKTKTPPVSQEVAQILLSSYCCTETTRKLVGIVFTGSDHSTSCKERG